MLEMAKVGGEDVDMFALSAGEIHLTWDERGTLGSLALGGRVISQDRASRYFLNGTEAGVGEAKAGGPGRGEVDVRARTGAGRVSVAWSGGRHIGVKVTAETVEADGVREAGFSVRLPPADVLTLTGTVWTWTQVSVGERVSLDQVAFAMGQVFLMRLDDGRCLRVGRQVHQRRDYMTGHLTRTPEGWDLVWLWQPARPFPQHFEAQPLQFALFPSPEAALDEHREWMTREFDLKPLDQNPRAPDWLQRCPIVFQVNLGETCGAIVHDYFDVSRLIEDLRRHGVPGDAILYIPDYNFLSFIIKGEVGPNCASWPQNPLLGGEQAFRDMVKAARDCGYHIMPHSSIVLQFREVRSPIRDRDGQTVIWRNPEWDVLRQWAMRNADGRERCWPPTEEEFAGVSTWANQYPYVVTYLNQSYPEVRRYYVEGVTALLQEFGLDAIYFDSLSNCGAWLSVWNTEAEQRGRAEGERDIIRQLYERNPGVLLAGEGCTEETADLVPLWNTRSTEQFRLLHACARTFAHTCTASPIPQRWARGGGISHYHGDANRNEVELTRRQPNNIPRLLINYRDRGLDDLTLRCIDELLDCTPAPAKGE